MLLTRGNRIAKYAVLACAQLLALVVFVALSRAESGRPEGTNDVSCALSQPPPKTTIIFVDSLRLETARDPALMPALGALAQTGVALEVTPCRDQLTYLCLRAVLTGYDESSLLAIRGNFTHEKSVGQGLLDRLANAGRRVTVVGSRDFEPYESALFRAKFRTGSAASEALLLSDLDYIDPQRKTDVTIVSLSSGDRTAHAFGTRGPEYAAAFHALDDLIAKVVARAGPDANVLVFGDHGHDENGRHLPGLSSVTYAVYAGPSFRRGVVSHAALTDHRAILGALLGVPSPPSYGGPPLTQIFSPEFSSQHSANALAALRAPPTRRGSHGARVVLALLAFALGTLSLRSALELVGVSLPCAWLTAVLAAGSMAFAGSYYDALRDLIHDHGYEPLRSLWLLVPLSSGFVIAYLFRSPETRAAQLLERGALASLLVTFCLLFPTAYYYGSGRATVLAAIIAVLTVSALRMRAISIASQRVRVAGLALLLSLALASLYSVRGVGGETREMAYFVLSSPIYGKYAWVALCFGKLGLWYGFAVRPDRSRRDLASAAGLALLALGFECAPLGHSRYFLAIFAVAHLGLKYAVPKKLPATAFFMGLLALDQFYGVEAAHLAPMQMLGLCLVLASRLWLLLEHPRSRAAARALTGVVFAYLMLWPTLGMRFSGIDFRFMFDWVPMARYEELWWLIGSGVLLKFVWPYALLADLLQPALTGRARVWLCAVFSAKLAALSVFAAWYAKGHAMLSNGALEILAELALLIAITASAWPSPLRALRHLTVAVRSTGFSALGRAAISRAHCMASRRAP